MAPRRVTPQLSGGQLIMRFSIAAFLALAVVSIASAVISRRVGRDEAISDARQATFLIAKGIVEPALTPEVLAMTPEGLGHHG